MYINTVSCTKTEELCFVSHQFDVHFDPMKHPIILTFEVRMPSLYGLISVDPPVVKEAPHNT